MVLAETKPEPVSDSNPGYQGGAETSSRRTSSSSQFSSSNSSTNIDRLYKLVHELKEEDLSNHKRKIAEKRAELEKGGGVDMTPPRKSSTDDTSQSSCNVIEPLRTAELIQPHRVQQFPALSQGFVVSSHVTLHVTLVILFNCDDCSDVVSAATTSCPC